MESQSPSRGNLLDWVVTTLGDIDQHPAAHHRLLVDELEAISRGDIDRLMILMPPGSAKSTFVSVLFAAWWFTQHPCNSVIATSHTAKLAEYLGHRTRRVIVQETHRLGYRIAPDTRASSHWSTSSGGEYCAIGVRGAIAGRRADLAIIDDPIRSQADADSRTYRDHLWNWYRSDLTTRLKPQARVVLIMTRWHDDDLGGRLLEQSPTEWRVLKLAAFSETIDPLGRVPEASLWPKWENAHALLRKRDTLGERNWSALFQQAPRPTTGALFQADRLEFIDVAPILPPGSVVRGWDLAATVEANGNDPDWTVGVKLMRDDTGRYTILDIMRMRGTPHQVEERIMATARADGRNVIISLPEDPGQAGKGQIAYLTARLAGHHVTASKETGSKTTRATPVASQIEAGNVSIVRAGWNYEFIEELRGFPFGRKDDQVDALAQAFSTLTNIGSPIRRTRVMHLGR